MILNTLKTKTILELFLVIDIEPQITQSLSIYFIVNKRLQKILTKGKYFSCGMMTLNKKAKGTYEYLEKKGGGTHVLGNFESLIPNSEIGKSVIQVTLHNTDLAGIVKHAVVRTKRCTCYSKTRGK